jgi:DNA-binding response OmpR family regulator
VLVVLDRALLAETVRLAHNHGRFHMYVVQTAEEALVTLGKWRPHLAIIDMDIAPGQLLDRLREASADGTRIPVIALTRQVDLKTQLAAVDQGVDDILIVPFSPQELLARVLALLRRVHGLSVAFTPTITVGDLEIDILNRRVRIGTNEAHLTALELSLLYLLAANPGRVVTREEILDAAWGVDYLPESNVVDQHVRTLRAKLQDDWRRPRYIATVPGRGYRFVPAAADDAGAPAHP